ncbi:hypothetical protein KKA72_01200, partial [Patescibacteria group bacterium]|nr:hypothetical protein [Patescibacteria group bacterium]MBU1876948.1 hypothetical protein [Patescibacteria group bacterium]
MKKKIRKLNKVIVLTGILLCILAIFSNIIVDNVEMKDWGVDLIFGRGSILFYGIAILLSSWIIFLLFNNYFKKSSKEKLKIQYFLIGAFIWIIINIIFNMVLPIWQKSIRYSLIGNYSAIFLLAFTAYAIVKKNLFGIKIVLTALLVSLIALSILIDIFFLTPDLLAKLFKTLLLVVFLY